MSVKAWHIAIPGEEPETLKEAPHSRPVRRLDEVRAAKNPVVKYGFEPAQATTEV